MRKAMILGLTLAGIALALPEPAAALRWGDQISGPCGAALRNGTRTDCSRIISYILWDIPWGKSWEATCAATPGPGPGWGVPSYCYNDRLHIRGFWEFQFAPTCGTACPSNYIK